MLAFQANEEGPSPSGGTNRVEMWYNNPMGFKDIETKRAYYRERYRQNCEFVQNYKVDKGCTDCGWKERSILSRPQIIIHAILDIHGGYSRVAQASGCDPLNESSILSSHPMGY